jgi:hypothetical protein
MHSRQDAAPTELRLPFPQEKIPLDSEKSIGRGAASYGFDCFFSKKKIL